MTVPATPRGKVLAIKTRSCKLFGGVENWGGSSGKLRMEYRDVTNNGSWQHTPYTTQIYGTFPITNLKPGTKYQFRLFAVNNGNESVNSTTAYFTTFPEVGTAYLPNGTKRKITLGIDVPYISTPLGSQIQKRNYFLLPFGPGMDQCVMQIWFSRNMDAETSQNDDFQIITGSDLVTEYGVGPNLESTLCSNTDYLRHFSSYTNCVNTGSNGGGWHRFEYYKWDTSDINYAVIHLGTSNSVIDCPLDWIGGQRAMWPDSNPTTDGPPISGIWSNAVLSKGFKNYTFLYLNMNYQSSHWRPAHSPVYIYRIRVTTHTGNSSYPAPPLYDYVPVKAGSTTYSPIPATKNGLFDLVSGTYLYPNVSCNYGTKRRRAIPIMFTCDSNGNVTKRRLK